MVAAVTETSTKMSFIRLHLSLWP